MIKPCYRVFEKSFEFPLNSRPMIKPKRPNTDEKISITRIFTNLQPHLSAILPHNSSRLPCQPNPYSEYRLYSQTRIRSVGQCSTTPIDPHTNSTDQIAHPDQYPRPK